MNNLSDVSMLIYQATDHAMYEKIQTKADDDSLIALYDMQCDVRVAENDQLTEVWIDADATENGVLLQHRLAVNAAIMEFCK
jgi:hypothetical protein